MTTQINQLQLDEKIRLVEDIWDSIAAEQSAIPITNEQKAALDSRLNAYELDGIKGREASVIIAEIKNRL